MAGRRRKNPDNPSATGPGEHPAEGLLPADFALEDLYGAFAAHGLDDEDLDDAAVLVPPVRLPSEQELTAEALAVPMLGYALKLSRWTAPHRAVDEFGDLTEPDREPAARLLGLAAAEGEVAEEEVVEAMRAWSLACDLDLVEIGTTASGEHVAIPGPDLEPAEQGDPETVLELWLTAAGIVRELAAEADSLPAEGEEEDEAEEGSEEDEARLAEVEESRDAAAELLDEALQVLYETTAFAEPGTETVPLGVLAALLVVPEGEEPSEELLGDITDVMVALDPMLGDLAELGLLVYRPIDPELFDEEDGETPAPAGDEPLDEAESARFGLVRLTPLGVYAVRQWLLEDGYDAPLVGELAQGDAAELLTAVAESANVLPEEEIREWLDGREPLPAARDLLAAARGTDTYAPLRRLLCRLALDQLGSPAEPAVREVLDDPELGGAARAWLAAAGAADVPAPERPMVLWTVVDTFAAHLLDSGGDAGTLRDLVTGLPVTDNPASYFGELWRVDHPNTADVLDAVGELHLDRQVAKEARKAAFKARSKN
ncbi:hypothetical protein GCM10010495_26790 [Kitasatospora herbaricolor]|uniref:hypothetical protein n=1 Tax=Kitasatospora herbaricolor TaxID=68217 RepID=UPI001748F4AB|nr:hypothetical protein [Kitasatospora herbaricolor]MDQ0311123.1 hypothetical protein [Kitasatospora herbaricolor]GGV11867.1 hypothetical protein GCM10010495_26790 [Kitasatospora herbaricolor]